MFSHSFHLVLTLQKKDKKAPCMRKVLWYVLTFPALALSNRFKWSTGAPVLSACPAQAPILFLLRLKFTINFFYLQPFHCFADKIKLRYRLSGIVNLIALLKAAVKDLQ